MKKRVYIASPYTLGDQLENVNVQMDMYSELLDLGFLPFAPLYSHYVHERHPKSYDAWMEVDYEWINVCDCLLRLPGESGGADLEVKHAESKGIPVFYSVEDLIKYYE
jgi:nucleoside 2-deoxyribosyltransferase